MKLQLWASKLGEAGLQHFRRLLDLVSGPESQPELFLEELCRALASEERIRRTLGCVKPWVHPILRLAVSRFGTLPFQSRELEGAALAEGISGAHVKAALLTMRHYGWIMPLRKSWGEEVYLFPEDTLAVWHRLLFPGALREPEVNVDDEGERIGNAGCAAYDVLSLLMLLRGEGIPMTKSGVWSKASLKKLAAALIVSDEDLASAGLQLKAEAGCGPAAASVMDLGIRSGLIAVADGRWRLKAEAASLWVRQSVEQAQRKLYLHWKSVIPQSEAWEIHALARLEQAEAGKWYLLDELFEWLRDCGMMNRIAEDLLSDYVLSRLLPMQVFGFIRIRRLPDGSVAFQLPYSLAEEAHGSPEVYRGLVVQPDMELILAPYPPLILLWEIGVWTETVNRGEMFVLRLTRESIRQGVSLGTDADHMLALLAEYCFGGIDPHVAGTIKEWAGASQATVRTGLALLELRDRRLRTVVEEDAESKACGLERLGEGWYAVPLPMLEKLERRLDRLGIVSVRQSSAADHPDLTAAEEEAEREAPKPLLLPGRIDPVCTPSPESPATGSGEWNHVPAAWLQRLASYHPSTRKEMIRKAIEWKAPVRLAGVGSEDWELIPLAIRENGYQWIVEGLRGREKVQVLPEEWEQIRIILPGVSD